MTIVSDNRRKHTAIHEAALYIASRGKPVFPCKPDKAPYTPNGFKDASANPSRVTALWTRYRGEKIGVPTGKASGVFVVDIDRLDALGELPRELPETRTIRTGGGGLHFYFNYVNGITNRTGSLPDGIDIRGEGGYVIVAPSEGYTVERRAPIADAPEWLLEALRDEPKRATRKPGAPSAGVADDGGPIPDGARNMTLVRIAGRLHDGTRDLAQLEDDLQAVNDARCVPPLPFEEIRKIAASVYRYEPCRPGRRPLDVETVDALERAERMISSGEWKGKGGKTRYSIAVAALKIARQYGTKVEDGVSVSVSARQLALTAGVSRVSVARNLKVMSDTLRVDNEGAQPGKSGTIILLCPPARTDTTLPTELLTEGGCISWRAPLTAPRLRWSSPAQRQRRGVTPGTSRVRAGIVSKRRDAVLRLGKSCEQALDVAEMKGGTVTLSELAAAIGVKRSRDLLRRRNPETGKGRDGVVTRLVDVDVMEVAGDTVTLTAEWLDALNAERDRAGEIALYRRDMAQYNRDRDGFRNRDKVKATKHWANDRKADGFIEDLQPVDEDVLVPEDETVVSTSPLAVAIRDYLDRNPQDACQKPYWLGQTLYVYDWYPKTTPDEVKAAIEELGGERYLRDRLASARRTG